MVSEGHVFTFDLALGIVFEGAVPGSLSGPQSPDNWICPESVTHKSAKCVQQKGAERIDHCTLGNASVVPREENARVRKSVGVQGEESTDHEPHLINCVRHALYVLVMVLFRVFGPK